MPRPTRIEYENAFYHVMNRGRARNNIFFKDIHYQFFLNILKESSERFGIIIHCYCLMPNHYHLLIQTPNANLGRVMRHINGVYTQRYNKLQKIDGPLFRGRYKAILVDEDDYLLELSKYIHKNPIQTKNKERRLVDRLSNYKWSSYPSYLNLVNTPKWLNKELTFSMFKNDKDLLKRYQLFIENEDNQELEDFFSKKNKESILGGINFKRNVCNKLMNKEVKRIESKEDIRNKIKKEINNRITVDKIIESVEKVFNVTKNTILKKENGQRKKNVPRSFAMYLIQRHKDYKLEQIAQIFGLNNYKSVSYQISKLRGKINDGFYKEEIYLLKKNLYLEQELDLLC